MLELVITLTVVAIAATMAASSFTGVKKTSQLTAATNEFVGALRFARFEALRRNTSVEMVAADGDWAGGWVVQTAADKELLRSYKPLARSVTLEGEQGSFMFNVSGNLSSPPDTVLVCDDRTGEKGRQVTISIVGRVTINPEVTCS